MNSAKELRRLGRRGNRTRVLGLCPQQGPGTRSGSRGLCEELLCAAKVGSLSPRERAGVRGNRRCELNSASDRAFGCRSAALRSALSHRAKSHLIAANRAKKSSCGLKTFESQPRTNDDDEGGRYGDRKPDFRHLTSVIEAESELISGASHLRGTCVKCGA